MFKFQDSDDFLFIENVRRTIKMKMNRAGCETFFSIGLIIFAGIGWREY